MVRTCALSGEGVEDLRREMVRAVVEGRLDASASDCLLNARQRAAVRRAVREVERAEEAVEGGLGLEFAAFNLREAADALLKVTGQTAGRRRPGPHIQSLLHRQVKRQLAAVR